MKKTIGLFTLASCLLLTACNDEQKTVEVAKPAKTETTKEIIVVTPAPTVVVKDPPAKKTTISLDKNGVKVETKKVGIVIQKDNK